MRHSRATQALLVIALALILVSVVWVLYGTASSGWSGTLRIPLIVGSIGGILFIIIAPSLVRGADERK